MFSPKKALSSALTYAPYSLNQPGIPRHMSREGQKAMMKNPELKAEAERLLEERVLPILVELRKENKFKELSSDKKDDIENYIISKYAVEPVAYQANLIENTAAMTLNDRNRAIAAPVRPRMTPSGKPWPPRKTRHNRTPSGKPWPPRKEKISNILAEAMAAISVNQPHIMNVAAASLPISTKGYIPRPLNTKRNTSSAAAPNQEDTNSQLAEAMSKINIKTPNVNASPIYTTKFRRTIKKPEELLPNTLLAEAAAALNIGHAPTVRRMKRQGNRTGRLYGTYKRNIKNVLSPGGRTTKRRVIGRNDENSEE